MKNYFTNLMCGLRAHFATGMVLGSFSPHLYSGTLLSLPFRLKILLTLTLGSRDHIHPEFFSQPLFESWVRFCCTIPEPQDPFIEDTLRCFMQITRLHVVHVDLSFQLRSRTAPEWSQSILLP